MNPLHKPRVLIVEDDRSTCMILRAMIEKQGGEAICAHTFEEGVEHATSSYFNFAILDLGFPDLEGDAQDEWTMKIPALPTLVLTADPEAKKKPHHGILGVFQKRPGKGELETMLSQLMDKAWRTAKQFDVISNMITRLTVT